MDIGTDRRSVGIKLITIKIFPNDSAVLPGGPEADSRPNGLSALCICLVRRPDSTIPGPGWEDTMAVGGWRFDE